MFTLPKTTIDSVIEALNIGRENTEELLIEHDRSLGRSTRKNLHIVLRLESEIIKLSEAITKLTPPNL